MFDGFLRFYGQFLQSFTGTLEFIISVKIFPGIFLGSHGWVQRYGYHFVCVVVQGIQLFRAWFKAVSIGIYQFPVNFVFFPFLRIFQLAELEVVFFIIPFKGGLYNAADIGGALANACDSIFSGIVSFQYIGYRSIFQGCKVLILRERHRGEFHGLFSVVDDKRGKMPCPYIVHQHRENMV